MPVEESSSAIVLRARDYAESDRVVTLLTRDFGKLSGIAKGAKASRRRFEHKLEPLTAVMLYFRRRPAGQLVFITRAEPSPTAHGSLDDDLGKIALGSYMLELADALTTDEAEATSAFEVLTEALNVLSRGSISRGLRQAYELKMLRAAGYGLEFERCRLCETIVEYGGAAYFVIARGGIVCLRCRPEAPESAVRLEAASVAILAQLSRGTLYEATQSADAGAAATLALTRFLTSTLDRKLRSADFLDSVL